MAKWYLVCGPVCTDVIPILDDGTGPSEDYRDVLWVFAQTARRAKVLALRVFRKRAKEDWWNWGGSPFSGMTAESFPDSNQDNGGSNPNG